MRLFRQVLLELGVLAGLGSSATVYITDLPIFKALAPCATDAVSYIVQGLTNSKCPALVTPLATCACTQDQNSAAVGSMILTAVRSSCGTTATEDVASASVVFSAYCNQETTVAVPSPSSGAVSKYITDLSAFSDLGPCAGSALSYVVQHLTGEKCPSGASALESCACTKDQISLAVSGSLSYYVTYSCGSTHSEDIASAQAVFAGYCGLGAGISSFPSPSALAGAVTYHVTDLPIYSSLAKCAQSAVSYPILAQTNRDCPSNPRSLVSCICVKDGNLDAASSGITSSVKYNCGSTASADITSALAVLDYYCSAGKGLVTPAGVTASVTTTSKTTSTRATGATATSTKGSTVGGDSGTTSGTDSTTIRTLHAVPVAAIAGGVSGAAIVMIFILISGCVYYRRKRLNRPPQPLPNVAPNHPSTPGFKPELANTSIMRKPVAKTPVPNPTYTPVSPIEQPDMAELPSPAAPQTRMQRLRDAVLKRHEAHGSTPPAEVQGNGPWHEMHVP